MSEPSNAPESSGMNFSSITNTVNDGLQSAREGISSATNYATESINTAKTNVNSAVSDFSSKSVIDASSEFLSANSIIARFVFIILVLIVFVILLNLGIWLIKYFTDDSLSPYMVKGLINGSNYVMVDQNPKNANSIQVLKSNNQPSGIEFTWSVWLNITQPPTSTKYDCIFVKGTIPTNSNNGISPVNNAPGLYVAPSNYSSTTNTVGAYTTDLSMNTAALCLILDTTNESGSLLGNDNYNNKATNETIFIPNIPLQKWFHVDIRLQNKILDVYINGVATTRKIFQYIPKQNYDNVYVCPNGGFAGQLSDLRYFSYALNSLQINNMVNAGVNLTTSKSSSLGNTAKYTSYLSNSWYSS